MSYKEYHGDVAKVCDQCGYILEHVENAQPKRDDLTGEIKFYIKSIKVESVLAQSRHTCDDSKNCEIYK